MALRERVLRPYGARAWRWRSQKRDLTSPSQHINCCTQPWAQTLTLIPKPPSLPDWRAVTGFAFLSLVLVSSYQGNKVCYASKPKKLRNEAILLVKGQKTIQGVYTRVWVRSVRMWSIANVASLSLHISSQENSLPSLRNQFSCMGLLLSSNTKFIKKCFGL